MNITNGQSAQKQHLRNGSSTACNRKTSGINTHDFQDYTSWAKEQQGLCCKKCLKRFTEKYERLKK
jgi:hypothetical protein